MAAKTAEVITPLSRSLPRAAVQLIACGAFLYGAWLIYEPAAFIIGALGAGLWSYGGKDAAD